MVAIEGLLTLLSVKGLGNVSVNKLLMTFGDPLKVFDAHLDEISSVVGLEKAKRIKNLEGVDESKVNRTVAIIKREGYKTLTILDPEYPSGLRGLGDSPSVLFYVGCVKNVKLVGVVGSRRASFYSLSFVDRLIRGLVSAGYGTVSGGAMGVDNRVHVSTISEHGYTVCVPGCGLLHFQNDLMDKIREGNGLILSEFLPEERGSRYTFPKRNRIIAAMSEFLVIPEAGSKSGALITAKYAYKLGKDIYAYVGMGSRKRWEGCKSVINSGAAKLVMGAEDILKERGCVIESDDTVLRLLNRPKTFDELEQETGIYGRDLLEILSVLELEGKIKRFGSFYST